jgi:hypothetical protein
MNTKLFKKLAEQAGIDLGNGQSYKIENFAELIVEEFIRIVKRNMLKPCGYDANYYEQLAAANQVEDIYEDIKKTFGVEE